MLERLGAEPALDDRELRLDRVVQPQGAVELVALVLGKRRGELDSSPLAEGISRAHAEQVAGQDGVDLVSDPGPLPDQARPVRHSSAQGAYLSIRDPDLRDEARGTELGQHAGVDLVGLDLGRRDRLGLHRVRDGDPPGSPPQHVDHRPPHRRRLDHDVVVGGERVGEDLEVGHLDPPDPAGSPALADGDLEKPLVHVHSEGAHLLLLRRIAIDFAGGRAARQLRIRARSATGRVVGRPDVTLGLAVHTLELGLP